MSTHVRSSIYSKALKSKNISNNENLHSYIDLMFSSAAKGIRIIIKLKFTFNRPSLNQIYRSYVQGILKNWSEVWDGCSLQDLKVLENCKM